MGYKCECLAKKVLEVLVSELNVYNGEDMLNGYLDSLTGVVVNGEPINLVLKRMGVDTLSVIDTNSGYRVSVSHVRRELYVYDVEDNLKFSILEGDISVDQMSMLLQLDIEDNDEAIWDWLEENYGDVLSDLGLT